MNTPCFFQTGLNVLLEEKVAEDQLIFIDGLFADDQGQWPVNFVFDGEGFINFHYTWLLS